MILDAIKASLNDFIKCTDDNFHGAACSAEALLNDIEGEYPMWYRLRTEWQQCGEDNIKFDKYVNQYVKNKDDLLENLNEKANRFPTMEKRKYKVVCANKDEHEVYAISEKDAWEKAEKKYASVENVYLDESLNEDTKIGDLYYISYEDKAGDDAAYIIKAGSKEAAKERFLDLDFGEFISIDSISEEELADMQDEIDRGFIELDKSVNEALTEDTEKEGNHWVNKGDEGTHGKFRTKKAADDQRKAMFANGYTESFELKESQLELDNEDCAVGNYYIPTNSGKSKVPYTWMPKDIRRLFNYLGITDEDINKADAGKDYLMDFGALEDAVEGELDYDEGQQEEAVVNCIYRYLNDLYENHGVASSGPEQGSRAYHK